MQSKMEKVGNAFKERACEQYKDNDRSLKN